MVAVQQFPGVKLKSNFNMYILLGCQFHWKSESVCACLMVGVSVSSASVAQLFV
jgi:hypothetical protein